MKRIDVNKDSVRNSLLKKLSLLSPEEIYSLSFAITNQVIKLFRSCPELVSQVGAGYLPLKAEVAPVYQELLRAVPLNLSYPILLGEEMAFAIPQGMPRGMIWLQPPYHEISPSWILVPGVGFDLKGARLGRGKGFYDRFLKSHPALTVGIGWSEQIEDKIPVESHDYHMDYIITENFCWDVKQQKSF